MIGLKIKEYEHRNPVKNKLVKPHANAHRTWSEQLADLHSGLIGLRQWVNAQLDQFEQRLLQLTKMHSMKMNIDMDIERQDVLNLNIDWQDMVNTDGVNLQMVNTDLDQPRIERLKLNINNNARQQEQTNNNMKSGSNKQEPSIVLQELNKLQTILKQHISQCRPSPQNHPASQ